MRKWLLAALSGVLSVFTFSGCMMQPTNTQTESSSTPETVEEVVDYVLEELEYDYTYEELVEIIEEYSEENVGAFLDTMYYDYDLDIEDLLYRMQDDDIVDLLNDIEEGLGDTIYYLDIEEYLDATVGEVWNELTGDGEEEEEDQSSKEEEEDDGYVTVKFDLCTDLETNKVFDQEVEIGATITKPNVVVKGENPTNAEVEAWYTDPEYSEDSKWSFLMDTAEEDITLYAKWVGKFSVTYYLGSEETAMYNEKVPVGTMYTPDPNWADGYKCNGFYFERLWNNVTNRYDFFDEVPESFEIESDVNIYINRSEEMYLDGEMIAQRFTPVAGGPNDGGVPGTLEYVSDGDYAKVNFGYSPVVADSHILLSGVTIDITKSQKLRVTLKNLGQADGLKFYFISWVDSENQIFANGPSMNEACTSYYKYAADEKGMTEDSEWITIELDIAKDSMFNGVSMWGTSETLVALRIQSGYLSKDATDLSNEVWIKSIEGVADDTYISSEDTDAVKEMLVNDAEEDLIAASEAQESVAGFVFPKNREGVVAEEGTSVYNKVNGLLFYGAYLQTEAKITLYPAEGQIIDLNELTTLNFRLRNYGYATQFTIKYYNKNGRSATKEIVIDANMSEVKDYVVNMFMADNYKGELDRLEITYQSVGNDNAILFESITFTEFTATDIAGFNFVDRYTFGVTSTENMQVSFVEDNTKSGTQFDVVATGSWFEKNYTNFAINAYENVVLSYKMDNEGITAVKLYLTVDGVETEYVFETAVSSDLAQIALPLTTVGNVTNMRVVFEGTGSIRIREITFQLPATAVNFGSSTPQSNAGGNKHDWMPTGNYLPDVSATQYKSTPVRNNDGTYSVDHFRYYPCATGGADKNISLEGKTKLVIIYQNRTANANFSVAFGLASTLEEGWEYKISQAFGENGTGEYPCTDMLTNMSAGEWAAVEIDLVDLGNIMEETLDTTAISCIFFGPTKADTATEIYIRAVAFI